MKQLVLSKEIKTEGKRYTILLISNRVYNILFYNIYNKYMEKM